MTEPLRLVEGPPPDQVHFVHDLWAIMNPDGKHIVIVFDCPFIKGLGMEEFDIVVGAVGMIRSHHHNEGSSFALNIEVPEKNLKFVVAFPVKEHHLNLEVLFRCTYLVLLPDMPKTLDLGVLTNAKDALTICVQDYDLKPWLEVLDLIRVTAELTG